MNTKKKFFTVLIFFCISLNCIFCGEKRYVNCKQLDLRSTNTNFGRKVCSVYYGDELDLVSEKDDWYELKTENGIAGWAKNTNLSKRKISSTSFSVKKDEIALAGKGFGEELEGAYKKKAINANYYQINATEKLRLADVELKKFLVDGKLNYITEENSQNWKKTVSGIMLAIKAYLPENETSDSFTSEQKYYIGRAVCANLLAKYKIYNSSKAHKYLTEICHTLTLNCDEPELFNGWTVFILDSNEINAFATSGGHILITRGLLKCAESEDALASVIAHEISHVLLGHSIKAMELNSKSSKITSLWNNALEKAEKQFGTQITDVLNDFTEVIDGGAMNLLEKGYSQSQEFEADSKALQLMAVAGYNPNAMIKMLDKIKQNESSSKGMKNHPNAESRIANVQVRLKLLKNNSTGEPLRNKRFSTIYMAF